MNGYKTLNPTEFDLKSWHPYMIGSVVPRPIAWVTTIDGQGRPNLAPFSYFNIFSSKPPIAIFSPSTSARTGDLKDTHKNLLEVPECVIHLVPYALAARMNITTGEYARGINEIVKAGLKTIPSEAVKPPRIAGTPVQMEAQLRQIISLGENPGAGQLMIVEIVRLHLAEDILDEQGLPDPRKMDIIARLGGFWYLRIRPENLFWMKQPRDPNEVMSWEDLPADIRESPILSAADIGHLLANPPQGGERLRNSSPPANYIEVHRKMKALLPHAPQQAWTLYLEALRE
ncbi:MAG: flavin reductase family protein [Bacteroidia bacterium]|nr:flavin reductase family protein [Bacteroidia bacterium]MDW8134829.1 flavin reductase family protein [Bacteroidia bacterium]